MRSTDDVDSENTERQNNIEVWNDLVSPRDLLICLLLILVLKRASIASCYPCMRNFQISYTCTRVTVRCISYIYRSKLIAFLHLKDIASSIITAIVIHYSDLILSC